MSSVKKPVRYAHSEGHLDMCYDETGKYLLTCGSDGDVRMFDGFEDDDPISHRVGDVVYAIACKNERFYTASDDNAVRAHTLTEGDVDRIVTRFTAPATHLAFNCAGSKLIAGACDFTVKIVDVESSEQCMFQGHTAPILSVALHPQETFLASSSCATDGICLDVFLDEMYIRMYPVFQASSSCDGSVRIWNVSDQKVVKIISGLPKTNDFGSTKTLCRLAWDKQGKYLAVPMDNEVKVFETETWELAFSLKDDAIKEMASIVCFTPCGKYLTLSTRDGTVVVWHFRTQKQVAVDCHEKRLTITALAWNPNGTNELSFCDNHGNLGVMENLLPSDIDESEVSVTQEKGNHLIDDIFDDADDDMLLEASNRVSLVDGDDASSDDDEASIGKIKKRYSQMLEDDDSRDPDVDSKLGDDAGATPVASVVPPTFTQTYEPTPLQPPFQSSTSPVHLSHRFMVWNSVGIIIQYNTEEENSINVEFHDTATHHAMHLVNTLGHTMADLSSDAVLLACPSDLENPSKLVCVNFASQDNYKEWMTSMPHGEDIKTICVGDGWVAAATDKRQVRLFTVGGVQKEIFSLPGPVVTMAAFGSQLMVVYHSGLGIPGDQCLGVHLLQISSRKKAIIHGGQLPISPKSTLTWLGFSAEGTPFSVDSLGVVRMLNRAFCHSWVQVANTKMQCKGKSDHYWVVGVLENPQQLRVILCKGSRFPPTLPRPTVLLLPFQVPLCELSTDKGSLECHSGTDNGSGTNSTSGSGTDNASGTNSTSGNATVAQTMAVAQTIPVAMPQWHRQLQWHRHYQWQCHSGIDSTSGNATLAQTTPVAVAQTAPVATPQWHIQHQWQCSCGTDSTNGSDTGSTIHSATDSTNGSSRCGTDSTNGSATDSTIHSGTDSSSGNTTVAQTAPMAVPQWQWQTQNH
ncbi:WD repeat and HMG-box DNA-binding protein 1 [Lamellibrachia satsuma]|nr:WD repeat and HMG-box DNA-binding protein 1 [Lamellibrachia satsuma]